MHFEVRLTEKAKKDLKQICHYIREKDGKARANDVLKQFEEVVSRLETFPNRGPFPQELLQVGVRQFRQVFFKPYRLFYTVDQETVTIFFIVDGRRDLQSILFERLLT